MMLRTPEPLPSQLLVTLENPFSGAYRMDRRDLFCHAAGGPGAHCPGDKLT